MSAELTSDDNKVVYVPERNDARSKAIRDERLDFPPIYVAVGIYRLFTDKNLYIPVWDKCRHGFIRGAIVGLGWVREYATKRVSQALAVKI